MKKVVFALLFTVLLSFISCRDEAYIKGLEALKKKFLNYTQEPVDYSKQIKALNLKTKIEVGPIPIDSDPTILVKLGIKEDQAISILDQLEFSEASSFTQFDLSFDAQKDPEHVHHSGYIVEGVNIEEGKIYIAAVSYESNPEFIPQYARVKRCKKVLFFKKCKYVMEKKPFAFTNELKDLFLKSVTLEVTQKTVKQIDLKIQEQN